MTHNFVSHVEWCCRDIHKTAEFLRQLFNWHFKPFGNNYLLGNPEIGPAIGLSRSEQVVQGNNCLVFVTVKNIEMVLSQATTFGGSIYVEKTAIPDYGWYAQLKDPQGNIIGLFERIS